VRGRSRRPQVEKLKLIVQTSHARFIPRAVQKVVFEAARGFPAVVLPEPRRAGKTTLLRRLFPRASYVLLEDPDVQARARSDPQGPGQPGPAQGTVPLS